MKFVWVLVFLSIILMFLLPQNVEATQLQIIMDGQQVGIIFVALYAVYIFGIPIAGGFMFHRFFRKTMKKRQVKEKLERKFRAINIFISIIVGLMVFYLMNFDYVNTQLF